MSRSLLQSIDFFFFLFHSALILFNIFGWIIPKWQRPNLISLSLTAFSWFILGIWYGIGYCPFTDWHWKVRLLLGYNDESNSYIHFLMLQIFSVNLPENWVDRATLIIFFMSFSISMYLNVKNMYWKERKKTLNSPN